MGYTMMVQNEYLRHRQVTLSDSNMQVDGEIPRPLQTSRRIGEETKESPSIQSIQDRQRYACEYNSHEIIKESYASNTRHDENNDRFQSIQNPEYETPPNRVDDKKDATDYLNLICEYKRKRTFNEMESSDAKIDDTNLSMSRRDRLVNQVNRACDLPGNSANLNNQA